MEEKDEKSGGISSDLIRGHINTIILRTLYERDKYGYEIIEEIESNSHGQYTLKQPTLYSALKRLETQGYINAYWKTDEVSLGGRRKYYTLTDSGREITERNQAEWEYSRTIIDSLISNRSFDFSQPAPATVDFNILKQSTTRVPVIKDEETEEDEPVKELTPSPAPQPETVVIVQQPEEPTVVVQQPVPEPVQETVVVKEEVDVMTEEQRRERHENYLRLISEPVAPPEPDEPTPAADGIDTQKLIYNNKPETERDYRNLVNNLFNKTVDRSPAQPAQPTPQPAPKAKPIAARAEYATPQTSTVKLNETSVAANSDGFAADTADYAVTGMRRKRYNRGNALFFSSLIVGAVLLFITILSAVFTSQLGVTFAYPIVIAAIAAAQALIFFVIKCTDIGKNNRKPMNNSYLAACIVVTVIAVLVIAIVSVLIANFNAVGEVMAKLVIPAFVALNITLFGLCFYLFSK